MATNTMEPVKRSKSQHCGAIGCTNSRQHHPNLSFFRFPKDYDRCQRWLINSRRKDLIDAKKTPTQLNNAVVLCSMHFEGNQFYNSETRNRLLKTAVPTIFSVPNPPKALTPHRPPPRPRVSYTPSIPSVLAHTSTSSLPHDQAVSTNKEDTTLVLAEPNDLPSVPRRAPLTPKKKALKQKVDALRKRLKRREKKPGTSKQPATSIENVREVLSQHISGTALEFVIQQVKMSKLPKRGRRWNVDMKKFAISVFHSSPKTYKLLRKLFSLPSISTLKRSLRNIRLSTGFNNQVMEMLKTKVASMTETNKLCTFIFDEMTLKENVVYNQRDDRVDGFEDFGCARSKFIANHAAVFMVRGITGNWKQPFAYFFSSGPLQEKMLTRLIPEALTKLKEIGLYVKAIICDQGSNNRAALKSLGLSSQQPFILYQDVKYHVIFDPPHLLKNIRNNMKKHGFLVADKEVHWKHIQDFYCADTKLPVRLAPKLTRRHIELPAFTNLSVRLAAQVLSHSVYAGMATMITFGALPKEAEDTAEFAKKMDSMFNCFNSYTPKSKKPFSHAITNNSTHHAFLNECLTWINSITSKSKCKKPPCLEGWAISIKSLLALADDLTSNHGLKYLLTSRLNQDCLENLFSIIRGKGGNRDNPNVVEFKAALQQVMVDSFFITSDTKNCQDDLDSFLLKMVGNVPAPTAHNMELDTAREAETDAQDQEITDILTLQNENVIAYICGYLLKKVGKSSCPKCVQALTGTLNTSQSNHQLLANKCYFTPANGTGLQIPSNLLISVGLQLEKHYVSMSDQMFHQDGVKRTLSAYLLRMLTVNDDCLSALSNCSCLQGIINLFLNMRIHHSLKLSNQSFTKVGLKRNRKTLKLTHC